MGHINHSAFLLFGEPFVDAVSSTSGRSNVVGMNTYVVIVCFYSPERLSQIVWNHLSPEF